MNEQIAHRHVFDIPFSEQLPLLLTAIGGERIESYQYDQEGDEEGE